MSETSSKKPIFKRWGCWVIIFVLFVFIVIAAGSGSGETGLSHCEEVPTEIAAGISAGLKDESGMSLRNFRMVRPQEGGKWIFIAADLEGAGLDGTSEIAVFGMNALDYSGTTLSIDAVASEFTNWPLGSTTDFNLTMADEGATEARTCVSESFE